MITSQIITDFEKKYIPQRNHWNISSITQPNCQYSVSDGNTGLLENKNDIEKGVIMTIDLFTVPGTILD